MSWVGLQDTAEGIQVSVNDAPEVDGGSVATLACLTAPVRTGSGSG